MKVLDLNQLENNSVLQADICIVGTGPAGVSIARQFAQKNIKVLLLESGAMDEEPDTQALYDIESAAPRRINQDSIRRRIVGGSSYIWTGRCAPFHPLDFEERSWIPNTGWPVTRAELDPWIARAGEMLGTGPHCYDDAELWPHFKSTRPSPPLSTQDLEPMFWQFSKSPRNPKNSIDFGRDRLDLNAPNIELLLHANLTEIHTNASGTRVEGAIIRSLDGKRACVHAKALVLCCGGVENARLLLASNCSGAVAVGNQHDNVGRYLMDHTDSVVGSFDPRVSPAVRSRFGHYWWDNDQGRHVFLHGLALSREIQQREELLHCHAYVDCFDASSEDPWAALDRFKATRNVRDARIALSHPVQLAQGLYRRHVKHRPQLANLTRVQLHCILEQIPDPASRVTLSEDKRDAFGMPLSKIDWKISDTERRTAQRMTQLVCDEFARLGLPAPKLNPWLDKYSDWTSNCVEKAHPSGTTRMSLDPKKGVVDRNCQVHGVDGLYVAGSSVFPTSGAANPTLMIVSMALRLADWLQSRYVA